MAESFYGGRKGPSYNIVKKYSTGHFFKNFL